MKQPTAENWLDLAARRPLTTEEEARLDAWLQAHPGQLQSLAEERRLTNLLRRLPPAVVPSNFTARVLLATRSATMTPPARLGWRRWWPALRPGWQIATALGALGLVLVVQQRQQAQARFELAQGVASLPLEALAETDLWQNYDQIRFLPATPLPPIDELDAAIGSPGR